MKKKPHPIVKVLQFILVLISVFVVIAIFSAIVTWSYNKNNPQESISQEDNVQLNNIEQYHLSQGHNIKFVEDIF